ncbi:MAG: hypothetical protein V2I48_00890 [Xanthomonadales bacterium]|nr:hypothetical protein [Xanthomonadales bacterium]
MQSFSLGAGLAALAFWGFIASVVVAGIWYDIRKKEAQQETIRRLFESGQRIDDAKMDKLLSIGADKTDRLDRAFSITGMILLPAAIGLAVLGKVLGMQVPEAYLPLMGVAGLVACLGIGFFIAAAVAKRWYAEDENP